MVSTRGGARTGGDDSAEVDLKLRKKPVRKPTAATKAAKAAPATKTTRAKKVEPEREDEGADELQGDGSTAAPKVTRKGRARKDDVSTTTTAAQSKPAATTRTRAATVTKKVPATRTTKSNKPEIAAPDLVPPTQPKATRATRATASTRATAAKERAPPLSPKKITQVSKVPARDTKSTSVKASTGKQDGKAAAKAKPVTRRWGASDENADVPKLRPSTAEKQAERTSQKQSADGKPNLKKSPAKAVSQQEPIEIDDDTPMLTRPTTPTDSLRLEPDDNDEDDIQQETKEVDSEDEAAIEISADEICGPKTPMKRLSPRERSKYASASKSRHAEEVPMKTPARRFMVLGAEGGTPQTQKPYCKPSIPMSGVRPTTVARARDRAKVFPKLQPLALPRALEEVEETADDDTLSTSSYDDHTEVDMGTVSMADHDVDDEGPEMDPDEAESISVESVQIEEHDSVTIPFQMKDLSIVDVHSEVHDGENSGEKDDPNATILMKDEEMEDSMNSTLDASLRSEESVLVRHDMAFEAGETSICEESMEDVRLSTTTPKPETIVWANLRDDVTIPFNFDSVLSPSRTIGAEELDEPIIQVTDEHVETSQDVESVDCSADEQPASNVVEGLTLASPQYQRQSFGDVRLSLDATVNLSDFLDMSSLAEQPDQTTQSQVEMHSENTDLNTANTELTSEDEHPRGVTMAMSPQRPVTPVNIPSTPAQESLSALQDVPQQEPEDMPMPDTPHYAMPTIAFRRKSLPAIVYHTDMKNGSRPKTSDGASIARIAHPFTNMLAAQGESQQAISPFRRRLSIAQASGGLSRPQTPASSTPARKVAQNTPRTSDRGSSARTPRTSSRLSVRPTPKERFPGLPSRQTYEELATTPAAKTPRQSMSSTGKSVVKERFPALPPAEKYEDLVTTPVPASTKKSLPATPQFAEDHSSPVELGGDTAQQEERYPGLPHRRTYEEHARTAMPASRFRTPSQSPAKRPATAHKPASLRKVALKASTPRGSHTPIKTPLRAPAMTPGQVPLTPHPGAPLRGVNAFVDVFLNDGSSANSTYIAVLHSLGAKTTKTFNDRVTHVVFKEGSPATLQRLRLHNKQVADSAKGKAIFCVNGRWVNDSNSEGARMNETDEAYTVDIEDQRASKRRRKSMEPTSLLNIGGNVVRDTSRKSSLGRSSLGRALKAGSPSMESPTMAMSIDVAEKENSGDSSFGSFGDGSPATPAYLAAPDSLVQQTAPMNRVRKLDFDAQEQAKNRRLTFWDGGEF